MSLVAYRAAEHRGLAEEYAARTRREVRFWPRGELLPDADSLEVCISALSEIDGDLVANLTAIARRTGRLPGVFAGSTSEAIRRSMDLACAPPEIGSGLASRCDIVPTLDLPFVRSPRRTLLGNRASAQSVRQAVAHGHHLLYIYTHADGVDAMLPAGAILCALKGNASGRNPVSAAVPACVASGKCHRLEMPLADALSRTDLLSVDDVRAKILFFDACYMAPVAPQAAVGWDWTLLARVVDSGRIPCCVFGVELREGTHGDTGEVLDQIQEGGEIGKVLGGFLRSAYASDFDLAYLLIGDPAFRLTPNAHGQRASASYPERPSEPCNASPLRFVMKSLGREQEFSRDLLIVEGFGRSGGCLVQGAGARDRILEAISTVGKGWAAIYDGWVPLTRSVRWENDSCPCCGKESRVRIMTLPHPYESRRVMRCWSCGASSDQPASADVFVRWAVDHEAIEMKGLARDDSARVLVSSKARLERYTSIRVKPAALATGEFTMFKSELGPLSGPVGLSIYYMRGADFGIFTVRHNFSSATPGAAKC